MKISIFGLGYVGVVTAACFAKDGHTIVGVDVSPEKVDLINLGKSPIIEEDIDELVAAARSTGRLSATTDPAPAVKDSDLVIVCVGTPSAPNGSLSTRYVETVCEQIGALIKQRTTPLLLVMRSTLIAGSIRSVVLPALEKGAGGSLDGKCEVVFHPEFLREGTSVKDFYDPPKIVVGERVPGAGKLLLELYRGIAAPVFCTSYEIAEMVKYSDNIFHALKITFANEIGQFCQAHGVDSRAVMEIFCSDTKLNLSPRYLRPGFAFGGSCLPKDLRAFLHAARQHDVDTPMLAGVLPSNKSQIERVVQTILQTGTRRVGLWGLAFKPGTDDLRESPLVTLAELLCGKGVELKIHDEFVNVTRLVGGNKAFIEQVLPHLARLLIKASAELDTCELIILGHPAPAAQVQGWLACGKTVVDLCGNRPAPTNPAYRQIV
ncbi:MAG: nucleotide sugar dehydrogenase [Verrucomicrobiota bacterium]